MKLFASRFVSLFKESFVIVCSTKKTWISPGGPTRFVNVVESVRKVDGSIISERK